MYETFLCNRFNNFAALKGVKYGNCWQKQWLKIYNFPDLADFVTEPVSAPNYKDKFDGKFSYSPFQKNFASRVFRYLVIPERMS